MPLVISLYLPNINYIKGISTNSFILSNYYSLLERVLELKFVLNYFQQSPYDVFFGWPIGTEIYLGDDVARGYLHSSYVWLGSTLGIFFICPIIYKIYKSYHLSSSSLKIIKIFLVLSSAFTSLIFTNPFLTILLFIENKRS